MATTRISYDANKVWGAEVATFVQSVLDAKYRGARVKAAFDAMNGSPVNYTQLETELGLVAGTGGAMYDHVNNAVATINSISGMPDIDNGK